MCFYKCNHLCETISVINIDFNRSVVNMSVHWSNFSYICI